MPVYGWTWQAGAHARSVLPETTRSASQMRVVCLAPSKQKLRERHGLTRGELRDYVSETGNPTEIEAAVVPMALYARWIDDHRGDYVRVD